MQPAHTFPWDRRLNRRTFVQTSLLAGAGLAGLTLTARSAAANAALPAAALSPLAHATPAVINSPDGGLADVFILGDDGTIYETFYGRGPTGGWNDWFALPSGPTFVSAPAVYNTPNGDGQGYADLFSALALADDGVIYQILYSRDPNGGWGTWAPIPAGPSLASAPAAINSPDGGLLDVFVLGDDGRIYETFYGRGPNGGWNAWAALPAGPTFVSAPAVYNTPDGGLFSALALADDGVIYQVVYSRTDGSWSGWEPIPSGPALVSGPAVRNSPDGQLLDVFALGADGRIYETFYGRGPGGGWNEWDALPGGVDLVGGPAVINSPDGTLADVFACGADGRIYEIVYSRGANGGWREWAALPALS
jgi:hypothetical protein